MPQPTSAADQRRNRSRLAAAANRAGHRPHWQVTPVDGGGSRTQYFCGCGRYQSRAGRRDRARAGWVSHVRRVVGAK